MNVLLTGGSGDLGSALARQLDARGDRPVVFDLREPRAARGTFIEGSVLDRAALANATRGIECVVHIAAWHGIHENERTLAEFWDVNVTGTFNACDAARTAGAARFVYISSTSATNPNSFYGHTKVLGEQVVAGFAHRHRTRAVSLRTSAFVPHSSPFYKSFGAWVARFARGGAHLNDVVASVLLAIDRTAAPGAAHETFTIFGKSEFTHEERANWNAETFAKRYSEKDVALALECGIKPNECPRGPTAEEARAAADVLGYKPAYSLQDALNDLRKYGDAGPPSEPEA
jgi:UDP-glucose 4-epimerase